MLNITSNSNGFTVEAINNTYYPDNGKLTFGPNQVIMIIDDVSEMVTFKDNSNRRTLFSGIIGQISIDGVVVTRDNIIEKFAEVATSQGGGGGDMSNYYTKAQSDAKYATKTEVGEYFDNVAYASQEKKINFYHGDAVVASVDATAFIKDGMVSNVEVSNGNLVITFNVDAGKQDIVIPLSSIFNPDNYYDKTSTDSLLAAKADSSSLATVATTGSYNDLADKPTIPAAQIQSDWNQSDSSAVDFIKNKPTIPAAQIQSDWNQSSNESADFIKNKPTNVSSFTNDAGYLTQHQSLADYYTKTEVDGLIPSVEGYFDGAEYDSNSKRINFKHGSTVKAYIDATDFIKDGMVSNVEISGGNLVITFNADAGKETINIPLTDIFNPANYYTKYEINGKFSNVNTLLSDFEVQVDEQLAGKQDTLTAGANITIENNVISATGGGGAQQVQSDWNQSESSAVDFIKNKPFIPTITYDAQNTALVITTVPPQS